MCSTFFCCNIDKVIRNPANVQIDLYKSAALPGGLTSSICRSTKIYTCKLGVVGDDNKITMNNAIYVT